MCDLPNQHHVGARCGFYYRVLGYSYQAMLAHKRKFLRHSSWTDLAEELRQRVVRLGEQPIITQWGCAPELSEDRPCRSWHEVAEEIRTGNPPV